MVGFGSGCAERQDDGFRARIPAACKTQAACEALQDEARERFRRCEADPPHQFVRTSSTRPPCAEQQDDREDVAKRVAQLRREAEAKEQAQREKDDRISAAVGQQRERNRSFMRGLTGACSEQQAIEEFVKTMPADVPTTARPDFLRELRDRWTEERGHRIAKVSTNIDFAERRKIKLEDLENPDDALVAVNEERVHVAELRCEGRENADLTALQEKLDSWAAATSKGVAEEKQCRASTECTANRLAGPICTRIDDRRGYVEDMARERANPSGYVNTTYLHKLGTWIQEADDDISRMKREFAKEAKQPFSEARCRKK